MMWVAVRALFLLPIVATIVVTMYSIHIVDYLVGRPRADVAILLFLGSYLVTLPLSFVVARLAGMRTYSAFVAYMEAKAGISLARQRRLIYICTALILLMAAFVYWRAATALPPAPSPARDEAAEPSFRPPGSR